MEKINDKQILCVGGCKADMTDNLKIFPPDKYNYCHSYCCVCCPDARITPCDKEKIEGSSFTGGVFLLNKDTGQMKRYLPKRS